jgi:hypothetical protein
MSAADDVARGDSVRSVLRCEIDTPAQIWVQRQAIDLTGEWLNVGGAFMLPSGGKTSIGLGRCERLLPGGPNVRLIIAEVI